MNTPGGPPVQLIPPPLPPLVVHLTASTTPATNQSNSTLLSVADEQPPTNTHFGQGSDSEIRHAVTEMVGADSTSNSLIDFVEPYRAVDPAPAQGVDPAQPGAGDKAPAPAPDPANARPLPAISDPDIDAALDLSDARILTRSRDNAASRSDDNVDQGNTHWSLSALFGAAAVATGGYHLALREADRFRGRWIPRWAGAERPTKRKIGGSVPLGIALGSTPATLASRNHVNAAGRILPAAFVSELRAAWPIDQDRQASTDSRQLASALSNFASGG